MTNNKFYEEEERERVMLELSEVWDNWAMHTYGSIGKALDDIGQYGDKIYRPNIENYKKFPYFKQHQVEGKIPLSVMTQIKND